MRGVLYACAALAFTASVVSFAVADTAAAAPACPRGALSIYFSSGDATASAEAEKLLSRIRDAAMSCQPDTIDLVAHVDFAAEGQKALSLSLQRINLVAGELTTMGLSPERIRVVAQAVGEGEAPAGRMHQIDIVFRKIGELDQGPVRPARTINFVPDPA